MQFSKQESLEIKGIAIILMIVHHLFVFSNSSSIVLMEVAQFGKICVALYAFISGYGLYFSLKKNGTLSPLKRILKLYLRYWIVLIVFFIPFLIIENSDTLHIGAVKIFLNFLGIYCNFDPNVWFIFPYIMFIIILPIIAGFVGKLKSKKVQIVTEISVFFILPMLYIFVFNSSNISIGNGMINYLIGYVVYYIIAMVPFFTMGYMFSKYQIFSKINVGKLNKGIQVAIYILFLAATYFVRKISFFGPNGNTYIDLVTVPMFVFAIVGFMSIINLKPVHQTFGLLGNNSSNMWLVHGIYCQGSLRWLVDLPGNPILVIIFTIIISIISSIIIDVIYNGILKLFYMIKKHRSKR